MKTFLKNKKKITLQVYAEKRAGPMEIPIWANVKELRGIIAENVDEDPENIELTLNGRTMALESTLAELGVINQSRIDVRTLSNEEKSGRVYYKNSKKVKGQYNQVGSSSSDESGEGPPDAGRIRLHKVRQFREGKNLKLRDKLAKKYHDDITSIDFILETLKLHQKTAYRKTCRMGVAFILSLFILAGGYVFFWYMYETEADISKLSVRLEEAVAFITDLNPPGITLLSRTQVEVYSALPDWAKEYWPTYPEDKEFIGEITYEEMTVHYERFKLGFQPVIMLKIGDTYVRLYLYLCRENKENLDLYCFLGTMFASCELSCNAEEDSCILTGPYDTVTT